MYMHICMQVDMVWVWLFLVAHTCTDQYLLQVLLTSLKYTGDRLFQKAEPMLYNALLVTIKTAPSLAVFKRKAKVILIYESIQGIDWYIF